MKTGGGLLRERVRFDRRVRVDDGEGNKVASWLPMTTTAARIKPLTGGEEVIASRLAGVVRYEIWVRCSVSTRSIGSECRAVDTRSGKAFNVRAIVNPDEHRRYLIMTCDDGPVDG